MRTILLIACLAIGGCANITERQTKIIGVCAFIAVGVVAANQKSHSNPFDKQTPATHCGANRENCL